MEVESKTIRKVCRLTGHEEYRIVCCSIKLQPHYAEVFFEESYDLFLINDLSNYHEKSQMIK